MGVPVLILGKPGTGKSTSMRTLQGYDVALINVQGKPLPFRGSMQSAQSKDFDEITRWTVNARQNAIVIDDYGYAITDYYTRHSLGDERDRDQFEVYKVIAAKVYGLFDAIQRAPADKVAYIIMHLDQDAYGNLQPVTVGKLLNEKINLTGMVTVCLLSMVTDGDKYEFIANGLPPAKSPHDMFAAQRIPNDLKIIDDAIRDYWDLAPLETLPDGDAADAVAG